jgi:hypothetical protein
VNICGEGWICDGCDRKDIAHIERGGDVLHAIESGKHCGVDGIHLTEDAVARVGDVEEERGKECAAHNERVCV